MSCDVVILTSVPRFRPQLIRDMVSVCETHLSKPNPPSLAKYRALRCKIEHVAPDTEEFSRVEREVLRSARR